MEKPLKEIDPEIADLMVSRFVTKPVSVQMMLTVLLDQGDQAAAGVDCLDRL